MTITALISHADCFAHDMGVGHPECPQRIAVIHDQLIASGLDGLLKRFDAPLVEQDDLLRVHNVAYLETLEQSLPQSGLNHLDPDTTMCPGSLQAAKRAAGAGVLASQMVLAGDIKNAFCLVRPPGHHACRERAMGFCFYNNIAVAAGYALEVGGLERIAIVDFDVHHGNGTEDIFGGDERVLMIGSFQHPLYPYSGTASEYANMVNVPLNVGANGQNLRQEVSEPWAEAIDRHRPQMIFISAGFDAHVEDGISSLAFVEADYQWLTEFIIKQSAPYANGRIVSMLEGGYALSALGRSAVVHIRELIAA